MQDFANLARVMVFAALVELVQRLDSQALQRGHPIPAEIDSRGDAAAMEWLRTGTLPADLPSRIALHPRLWFANALLQAAKFHPLLLPSGGTVQSLLAVLLIDLWPQVGRAQWLRTPGEVLPGG